MFRRSTSALAAATLLSLLLAACDTAGPAITDPREIITQGIEATSGLTSAHLEVEVDGSVTLAELGGSEFSLSGTSLEGDIDIENQEAHLTFAVPSLLGLTGEVIQVGQDSYVKTSMTGELWSKSTVEESDPVSGALDPAEALAQVRSFLDEDGVEIEKLDDVDCGDGSCYAVRLSIPPSLLDEAGDATGMDPSEVLGEALVLTLLFDRADLFLTEASTSISGEGIGSVSLSLRLSGFNEGVDVTAPPEDQVTEDGGEFLPF